MKTPSLKITFAILFFILSFTLISSGIILHLFSLEQIKNQTKTIETLNYNQQKAFEEDGFSPSFYRSANLTSNAISNLQDQKSQYSSPLSALHHSKALYIFLFAFLSSLIGFFLIISQKTTKNPKPPLKSNYNHTKNTNPTQILS